MLICDACSNDASVRLCCGAGLFNYDFALGIDFAKSNQPVVFFNLKKSIARHIAAEMHQANLVRIGEESEHSRKWAAKQQSIGITVGKQAYRLLTLLLRNYIQESNLFVLYPRMNLIF